MRALNVSSVLGAMGAATNICSALRTSLTRKAPRTLLEVMARTGTGGRFGRLTRKHTLPKDRFLIRPAHKTGVNKIGSRLHSGNSFPTANGSQQNALRKTGIIKPSLRRAAIQGIFQQGSPGASKQGCLSARYVLHERDIGKAQTEKLTIQGSPGRGRRRNRR